MGKRPDRKSSGAFGVLDSGVSYGLWSALGLGAWQGIKSATRVLRDNPRRGVLPTLLVGVALFSKQKERRERSERLLGTMTGTDSAEPKPVAASGDAESAAPEPRGDSEV